MQTQPSKTDRILLIAAWVVVLLSSALPKIILQELLNQTVTWEKQAMISLGVALIALLVTFAWRRLRGFATFAGFVNRFSGKPMAHLPRYWPAAHFSKLAEEPVVQR